MQKTQLLIQSLVKDLPQASESHLWGQRFWRNWFLGFSLTGGLAVFASIMLPHHLNLPENIFSWNFLSQLMFWFCLSIASAFLTYFSSLPTKQTRIHKIFIASIFTIFLFFIFYNLDFSNLSSEFLHEFNWRQGPCGFFIFTLSGLWTYFMFSIIKKAAPTNLLQTGLALSLSTASATSMFIHLYCRHETSPHTLLWHLLPLLLIVGLISKNSSRFLRW